MTNSAFDEALGTFLLPTWKICLSDVPAAEDISQIVLKRIFFRNVLQTS